MFCIQLRIGETKTFSYKGVYRSVEVVEVFPTYFKGKFTDGKVKSFRYDRMGSGVALVCIG
jgi:hypothetical protein